MWIMTKFGFFSINKTKETPARCLQVRARRLEDLEALSEQLERSGWAGLRITTTLDADYQYRANVHYVAFVELIGSEIRSIDYANFKDTITARDPARAKIYSRVWATLLDLADDAIHVPFRQRPLFFNSEADQIADIFTGEYVPPGSVEFEPEEEEEPDGDSDPVDEVIKQVAVDEAVRQAIAETKPTTTTRRRPAKRKPALLSVMEQEVKRARRKPRQTKRRNTKGKSQNGKTNAAGN